MIGERRLERLEARADARTAVLRWMDEAQGHGSLDAHVRSLVGRPSTDWPYVAIPERARTHARASMSGARAEEVRAAERGAIEDALFLLELVVIVEERTRELCDVLVIRAGALRWERRARVAEGSDDAGWASWRSGVAELLAAVRRMDAGRALLEERFLDGRTVLFPDTADAWSRLGAAIDALVGEYPRITDEAIVILTASDARGIARELHLLARARAMAQLGDHERAAFEVQRELGSPAVGTVLAA